MSCMILARERAFCAFSLNLRQFETRILMPNFGLKCFLGSFIFSLLAVMAVTKGYFVLTEDNAPETLVLSETKQVHSIELFAQNDESDKIYEKFKKISAPSQVQAPLDEEITQETEQELEEGYDDISDTLAFDGEQTGDIIYDPDEEENSLAPHDKKEETNNQKMVAEADESDLSEYDNEEETEDLIIAEAYEAPKFIIPLKHTFGSSTIGETTVSAKVEGTPTALASQNVNVQAKTKDEALDDPWEKAAVSNPHITKNKIVEASKEHVDEVAALDKEKNSEAKAEGETKVAYKMMKNILIPIPDEIANDENLTPQLSYSAKNKKIDATLKNKQQQEEQKAKKLEQQAKEQEKIDDAESKTLTDSITDWFAQGKQQEKVNVIAEEEANIKADDDDSDYEDDEEEEESAFSKLLGLNKKKKGTKNIVPSELKLFFQPNRAEISGQTLEWLRAFSQNAVKDDEVTVEIRIDGSGSYELQQKRLNLLYTIFANNGVNYDKINIIFTARDPNSFIIRNVKYALENDAEKAKNEKKGPWYLN